MLRIHVLGELLVESDGKPVELTGSWRARSLLAWLALNPGTHARGELAARFWPEVLDSSARASLRNSLWALRKAVGGETAEALIATRERVVSKARRRSGWTPPPSRSISPRGSSTTRSPCAGASCWPGSRTNGPTSRATPTGCASPSCSRRWRCAPRTPSCRSPCRSTRKRVALDPLAEDAQRALIERLGKAGDRSGALSAYSRFRERLRRDLGLSASVETRALVDNIREGSATAEPAEGAAERPAEPTPDAGGGTWQAGAPFPLPRRLRQQAGTAFVGREDELGALRQLWSDVGKGAGARLALVVGEAGIGKSRLTRELALEARDAGAIVLHGSASEDLLMPHQHFVEAVAHLLAVAAPSELARRIDPRASDLGPVAPSLVAEHFRARVRRAAAGEPPLQALRGGGHAARGAGLRRPRAARVRRPALGRPVHRRPAAPRARVAARHPAARAGHAAPRRGSADADAKAEALQRLSQGHFVERVSLTGLADGDVAQLSHSVSGRELARS